MVGVTNEIVDETPTSASKKGTSICESPDPNAFSRPLVTESDPTSVVLTATESHGVTTAKKPTVTLLLRRSARLANQLNSSNLNSVSGNLDGNRARNNQEVTVEVPLQINYTVGRVKSVVRKGDNLLQAVLASRIEKASRDKIGFEEKPRCPSSLRKDAPKLPKPKSVLEKELRAFMRTLPLVKDASSMSTQEIDVEVSKMTRSTSKFLQSQSPPKSPNPVERLNSELHVLSRLKRSSSKAERVLLIEQLRITKVLFSIARPIARSVRLANRMVAFAIRKAKRLAALRRSKRDEVNLQALFKKAPKKCFAAIANGSGGVSTCTISAEILTKHFEESARGSKSARSPMNFDITPLVNRTGVRESRPREATDDENAGEPITIDEVLRQLKASNKGSAPGSDMLSLKVIVLGGAPFVRWLAKLFERLRTLGEVPNSWKQGEVQLIPKKGDPMDISNWRPITLLSVLYKLYFSILASRTHAHDRLLREENGKGLFSLSQRGFRPDVSGCTDNAALFKKWEKLTSSGGKLWAFFIDFKNAFGAMDHEVLWQCLSWLNVPTYLVNAIKSAYSGARIRIRFGERSVTSDIAIEKGVLQGDPFSPSLFAMVQEPLLRLLATEGDALAQNGVQKGNAAYADDVAAFATKKKSMERTILLLELYSNVTGIEVNTKKSAISLLTTSKSGQQSSRNPKLTYGKDKAEIAHLKGSETYMYLGAEAGGSRSGRITAKRLIETISKYGDMLHAAPIPAYMKRFLYLFFVVPKINYSLSIWTFPDSTLERFDKLNRKYAKGFEKLNSSFCTAALRAPAFLGGLEYPCFVDSAWLSFLIPYLKRLLRGDAEIRGSEMTDLLSEYNRLRALKASPPVAKIASLSPPEFIELCDDSTPRELRRIFAILSDVNISIHALDTDRPFLCELVDGNLETIALKTVRERIKVLFGMKYRTAWSGMKLEGECMNALDYCQLAPIAAQAPWITHPGLFTEKQRSFATQAQTNNISCETNHVRWGFSNDPICRACKEDSGSTRHVLNCCKVRLDLMRQRHDAGLSVLSAAIKKIMPNCRLLVDQTPDPNVAGCTLRPDVILVDDSPARKFAAILDVKCPFPVRPNGDDISFVDKSNLANQLKYEQIARNYRNKYGNCSVGTVVVPSVGPIPRLSFNALCAIGFKEKEAVKVLREMSIAVTRKNLLFAKTLPASSSH
jgi:hypothetical protein